MIMLPSRSDRRKFRSWAIAKVSKNLILWNTPRKKLAIGRFYSDRSDRSNWQKSHLLKLSKKKVSDRKNFATDAQIGKSAFCGTTQKNRRRKEFPVASAKKSWYSLNSAISSHLRMTFYSTKKHSQTRILPRMYGWLCYRVEAIEKPSAVER